MDTYVGYGVLTAVITRMKSFSFWDIRPCWAVHVTSFMLVSFLPFSSVVIMEATFSSETSVDFQRTTWHCIPEDKTRQINSYFIGGKASGA
jgi:hypothetical protein